MESILDKFRGLSFPFAIDGKVSLSQGIDYIRQGVLSSVSIDYFELLMKPEGSHVNETLFDPLDEILIQSLTIYIQEALQSYKPINITSVKVIPSVDTENAVSISVSYYIVNTNVRDVFDTTFLLNSGGLVAF